MRGSWIWMSRFACLRLKFSDALGEASWSLVSWELSYAAAGRVSMAWRERVSAGGERGEDVRARVLGHGCLLYLVYLASARGLV